MLGQIYVDLGENRLAKATFEREVALQPSNAQSWQDLADYYQGLPGRAARATPHGARTPDRALPRTRWTSPRRSSSLYAATLAERLVAGARRPLGAVIT